MIGVDENDNKPEPEDASHDNVDDFNEDAREVCLYDVHSTENNVEVQELFEDDRKLNLKKAEYKDATEDKVEDFNEDTCNVF